MKRNFILLAAAVVSVTACTKNDLQGKRHSCKPETTKEAASKQVADADGAKSSSALASRAVGVYTQYTIGTGLHTCDQTRLQWVSLSEMNFAVMFDNSAIYTTVSPSNQNDINMLYGFSEGISHKYNSARIGWTYSNGSLKLFAYAYNRGVIESKLITAVTIGSEITCKIKLTGNLYTFTVNGVTVTLARGAVSYSTSGYQLYPYFGGTETAPHAVSIMIKDL